MPVKAGRRVGLFSMNQNRSFALFRSVAVIALLAGASAGCKTTAQNSDITGSIGGNVSDTQLRQVTEAWGERYKSNPKDPEAAISYAQALRMSEQRAQAVAVLEQSAIQNPNNMKVLGAFGRALADVGDFKRALDVLGRAHTPDKPDWRILSVQGAVLDQMGRHKDGQRYYASALKIAPNEPSVLSNLGLSYALSNDLPLAEKTLRQAIAGGKVDPRVRQNLALVVGLRGRFAEAESIARADLPPDRAAENVAYLKDMLATDRFKRLGGAAGRDRDGPA